MTAPIVRDDAVSMRRQKEHLFIPSIAVEWPAVTEDDRLTVAPVLVKDAGIVSGLDGAHCLYSFE
ncbi:MAG TPA: hypothetical protein VFG30_16380 [Polyangiales bacterium]|nr:hypothetical protein [Polyangiales bacterium]